MACITFGALSCRKKNKTWWQLASRCCWNRASPWRASELVSFPVWLRDYQHPGKLRSDYFYANVCLMITDVKHQIVRAQGGGTVEAALSTVMSEWWGKGKSVPWRTANSGLLTRSQLCWLPSALPTGTTRRLGSVCWFRCYYGFTLVRAWDLCSSGVSRSL